MKKSLCCCILFSALIGKQSLCQCGQISIIGEFNNWAEDYFMSADTLNPGVYNANVHFSISDDADQNGIVELKFRQDSSWLINWGGTAFPEGTGIQDGSNIGATLGDYTVTFNCITGYYIFRPSCGEISMTGLSNQWTDTIFLAQDSTNLNLWKKSFSFTIDDDPLGFGFVGVIFRESSEWMHYWGGNAFPQSDAVFYGSYIQVPYGIYEVSFNCEMLEYNFKSISGIGELGPSHRKLTVFPNPAKETLNIWIDKSLNANSCNIAIADLSGRMILGKRLAVKPGEDRIEIDINFISPGIYLYRLAEIPERQGKSSLIATGKLIVIR
jgi:hypothetical protein